MLEQNEVAANTEIASNNLQNRLLELFLDISLKKYNGGKFYFAGNKDFETRSAQWMESNDTGLQVIGIDFLLRSERERLKTHTLKAAYGNEEAKNNLTAIETKISDLSEKRMSLAPQLDSQLKTNDIFTLTAQSLGQEEDDDYSKREPLWLISEGITSKMLETWISQRTDADKWQSLLPMVKEREKQRGIQQTRIKRALGIDNWKFKAKDTGDMVDVSRSSHYIVNALVNKYSENIDDLRPILRNLKPFMQEPQAIIKISQVLKLNSMDRHKQQHEKFARGEISFIPNNQEDLRPILLIDLIDKYIKNADANLSLVDWSKYWNQPFDHERRKKFLEILLDTGYNKFGEPVTEEDRTKILQRFDTILNPSQEQVISASERNQSLAQDNPIEIKITDKDLFHETDFSALDTIVAQGILANELIFQSKNANSAGESDLAASFWYLQRKDKAEMNLSEVVSIFYPKEGKAISTGAKLRDRIVIACLDPYNEESKDYMLYPRSSDKKDENIASKFIAGIDDMVRKTNIPGIEKDAAFTLLGLPNTANSFIIIRESLKEAYLQKAANFPFYIPAFSAESGKLIV